ncbi:MAG: HpcH/HpaI aldolase/citrate lyase family protein [Acidimicrobiales bacterium]
MTAAVSYLFVPATRPERIDKARRSAAQEVIVDLEDAVAADNKAAARQSLAGMPVGRPVHVRINARGTPHHEADLRAVAALASVSAVVLPKVESAEDVAAVTSALPTGLAVVALVETALGIVTADSIACSAVARIMFGSADYLADIGAPASREVLAYPRCRLVVASRAAGLPAPVDGPTLVTGDEGVVRAEAEEAKALGMGAKLCIHPAQVAVVNEVFAISGEERRWARSVLAAAEARGGGAFTFEGSMVDEPVLVRARQLLGPD